MHLRGEGGAGVRVISQEDGFLARSAYHQFLLFFNKASRRNFGLHNHPRTAFPLLQ